MNPDNIKMIAAAIVALSQVYMIAPWQFPIFARMWDWVARFCGWLANMLAWISMKARLNYYLVIQEAQ